MLQQEVQSFLLFTLGTKFEQDDQKDFLNLISPSLNEKVSIEIFSRVIQNNRIFKAIFKKKQAEIKQSMTFNASIQDVISLMIHKFETQLVEPENEIFKQFDDVGKNNNNIYFYLIAKGAVDVYIIDQKKKEREIDTMRNGEFFGEISLIYGCKRTATIKSAKYSTLAKLSKKNYLDILLEFPEL
jgi:signal-transduction protein with cAMP-binding, CBS, and nucleotidyltransferase domain